MSTDIEIPDTAQPTIEENFGSLFADDDEKKKSSGPSTQFREGIDTDKNKHASGQEETVEEKKSPSPSGQGSETFEENKSPSPSGKGSDTVEEKKSPSPSSQNVETGDEKKPSTPGAEEVENGDEKKSPSPSGQNVETDEQESSPPPSGQNFETGEEKKFPSPSGQGVENEAKKSAKGSEARRVSFSEPDKRRMEKPKGGFISNKDIKQPTIAENPGLTRPNFHAGTHSSGNSQLQPWLYAIFAILTLTIIMRFFMSNLKFASVVLYATLVSLLTLRFYGHGPFAGRRRRW